MKKTINSILAVILVLSMLISATSFVYAEDKVRSVYYEAARTVFKENIEPNDRAIKFCTKRSDVLNFILYGGSCGENILEWVYFDVSEDVPVSSYDGLQLLDMLGINTKSGFLDTFRSIELLGESYRNDSAMAFHINFAPEFFDLYDKMTDTEKIMFIAELYNHFSLWSKSDMFVDAYFDFPSWGGAERPEITSILDIFKPEVIATNEEVRDFFKKAQPYLASDNRTVEFSRYFTCKYSEELYSLLGKDMMSFDYFSGYFNEGITKNDVFFLVIEDNGPKIASLEVAASDIAALLDKASCDDQLFFYATIDKILSGKCVGYDERIDTEITYNPGVFACGDINFDGMITAKDVKALKSYIADLDVGRINLYAADINGDGIISSKDSRELRINVVG